MVASISATVSEGGKNVTNIPPQQDFAEFTQELKLTLIKDARDALEEAQKDGFDKKPRVVVDGRSGKAVTAVNPFGRIEFFARESADKVVFEIYDAIVKRSPIVTGQYRSGNYVFLGNRLIARDMSELKSFMKAAQTRGLPEDAIFRFINVNPYARKLERYGVRRGKQRIRYREAKSRRTRTAFIKVPNGAYALAFRAIRRKFSGQASFMKFQFHKNGERGIKIQSIPNEFQTAPYQGQPYLYPMIVFGLSRDGVLRE